MKRTLITVLLLSMMAYGQQRSLPPEKVLPGPAGTVTLSLAEYNRLVELAARKPKPAEAAPLPFIMSRAAFNLRIEKESAVGALDIDGEVLQKGATKVPLVSALTILDARQSQKPLPLLREGATHFGVLSGPGSFSVSLNVAAALTVDAGRAVLTLPVPAAGSGLLTLDIPGSHADARIEPGLITRRATVDGHTTVEAALEPGKTAKLWWTTREAGAPVAPREVRFLTDIKSILTVGDSETRLAALCDVTVVQGELDELSLPVPDGFEVTEATGSTLDSTETRQGELVLKVREPSRRTHQFLIAIERSGVGNKLEAPFMSLSGAQRETGELLVEGTGTMELTAAESGGLRRIDIREAGAVARSLARFPLQAAFRYHRRPGEQPKLALEWSQFADSPVLSAIAERATITTLVNIEGKSLTEITLRIRNHAQPFVKVGLPQGASLLSAEVEGEKVKPVQGADGSRVPLLRAGFRPSGAYTVSFVYLSSGAPFAKNGSYEMNIPKLDVPVNLVTWEVYVPERFQVKAFGGNAIPASLLPSGAQDLLASLAAGNDESNELDSSVWTQPTVDIASLGPGQIGGIVVDPTGAVVVGANVSVVHTQTGATLSAVTDGEGHWAVSGVPSGPVQVKVESPGFRAFENRMNFDASKAARLGTNLQVSGATETMNVTASAAELARENMRLEDQAKKAKEAQLTAPSQNVTNLQRRVAGILPVRVDVPRAGKSYRFARPLILEEETKITFQYKSR